MIIEAFRSSDIDPFMKLAAAEGWVAEPWECEFLLSSFPQGCFSARGENGEIVGFVTSLLHERSGWIGNLIVDERFRGMGVGEALFLKSLGALREFKAETIWLTASKKGKSLYEKHGFSRIDTIIRWSGFGQKQCGSSKPETAGKIMASPVSAIDRQVWDDRRDALLEATSGRGRQLIEDDGFLVIQPCGEARQLGPFSALNAGAAEKIFKNALSFVPDGTKFFLDAPVKNRAALHLFKRIKMRIVGSNALMYAGIKPDYRPELLYGLATMGSCG